MNLDTILAERLRLEGWPAVTNRAADKGGLTKGGVTFTEYNRWLKAQGQTPLLPLDFVNITEEQARDFMVHDIGGPLLAVGAIDPGLFTILFDWAMTSGPAVPCRMLQTLLREDGNTSLVIDGVYGRKTDAALRAVADPEFLQVLRRRLVDRRVVWYVQLALRDPAVLAFRQATPTTDLENVHGWVERALAVV